MKSIEFRCALISCLLGSLFLTVVPSLADSPFDRRNDRRNQFLLRASNVPGASAQHGLRVLRHRQHGGEEYVLVESPDGLTEEQFLDSVSSDPDIQQVEAVALASLSPTQLTLQESETQITPDLALTGTFATPCLATHIGTDLWAGYTYQRATWRTDLHFSHSLGGSHCGQGMTIAVIDTGVDEEHPLLASALVPGWDFLGETEGASEWSGLDHSARAIVEHSARAIVEQSSEVVLAGQATISALGGSSPILSQEQAAALEDLGLGPYFGHGTMVAGLIRLAAPGAQIMPLRAFDTEGSGHIFDIVEAIYFAVDHGADIINMSFSIEDPSDELSAAIQHAKRNGVLLVAAAGNQGAAEDVYPAALRAPIGVAALDLDDSLGSFSNWGMANAAIAAPGTAVVSLFPGGGFAAGWGTSFSAPLVSGTLALIRYLNPNGNQAGFRHTKDDLLDGTLAMPALEGMVSNGELNSFGALVEAILH